MSAFVSDIAFDPASALVQSAVVMQHNCLHCSVDKYATNHSCETSVYGLKMAHTGFLSGAGMLCQMHVKRIEGLL